MEAGKEKVMQGCSLSGLKHKRKSLVAIEQDRDTGLLVTDPS